MKRTAAGSMKANLDRKTGVYKYGYANLMRDALPNASFLGFTGTPVSAEDRVVLYLAITSQFVDIQDAVDDGATVLFTMNPAGKSSINRRRGGAVRSG